MRPAAAPETDCADATVGCCWDSAAYGWAADQNRATSPAAPYASQGRGTLLFLSETGRLEAGGARVPDGMPIEISTNYGEPIFC